MIAPEKWYEHQREYQKYGIDMKPKSERRTRAQRKKTEKKIKLPVANFRRVAAAGVVAGGIAMIFMIIIAAYSAGIRYDINTMIKNNNALMGEIENLQVKVYSANNVDYIEGKAVGQLGMVYPESKNRVYISSEEMPQEGFADMIREKAYN